MHFDFLIMLLLMWEVVEGGRDAIVSTWSLKNEKWR